MTHRTRVGRAGGAIKAPLLLVALAAMVLPAPELLAQSENGSGTRVPHAVVVVMENKNPRDLLGNRHAPYINQLIRQYGYADNYYGVTHPSLPNYLALIAGTFLNTWNDWDGNRYHARTIADQLESRHLTWKAYMGALPHAGYTGNQYPAGNRPLYESKHDPFVLMRSIRDNPAQARHIVSDREIFTDLTHGTLPTLSFISPDMCHDMHGISATRSPCPNNPSRLIAAGDAYLKHLIPAVVRSRSWTGNSVIFIVWDEADTAINGCCDSPRGDGGGKVPAIVIAREGARGYTSRAPYNHYSLLATLQTVWKLGCLQHTCDRAHVKPMTEFLLRHHS